MLYALLYTLRVSLRSTYRNTYTYVIRIVSQSVPRPLPHIASTTAASGNSPTITPEPGKRQIILRKPKKRPGGGLKPNRSPLRRQVPKIVYNTQVIYL